MIKSIIGSFTGVITPVISWSTRKSFSEYLVKSNNIANEIYYINDKFIVLGNNGRSNVSIDGLSWNLNNENLYETSKYSTTVISNGVSTTTDTYDDFLTLVYANNKYTIGGTRGFFHSTDDGNTWSRDDVFSGFTPMNIIFANNKYIAVGLSGKVLQYNTAASAWSNINVTSIFGTSNIYTIAYGNGIFVIGGNSGKCATSTDGTSWVVNNNLNSIFNGSYISHISYINNMFVAVGGAGRCATSTDGITWTTNTNFTTTFSTTYNVDRIIYGNGMFVAIGNDISTGYKSRCITSTDGITWSVNASFSSAMGSNKPVSSIAYGNGRYVAVGINNNSIVSTDGITWTNNATFGSYFYNPTYTYRTAKDITYGNGKYVVVGDYSNTAVSADLINWIPSQTALTLFGDGTSNISFSSVAYGNGVFVALASNGRSAVSTDGITWIANVNNAVKGTKVTYGKGIFLAANGTSLYKSTDGINWTIQTIQYMSEVRFINNLFIGNDKSSSSGGLIYISLDGVNWVTNNVIYSCITDLSYGNGRYVAIGFNSSYKATSLISNDGLTWYEGTNITSILGSSYPDAISFGKDIFLAISSNYILTSADGIVWDYKPKNGVINSSIEAVIYNDNVFITVGYLSEISIGN